MSQPTQIHTFFAAKGGQGTTVTAAVVALMYARAGRSTLLVDAAETHDSHAVLGLAEPAEPASRSRSSPTSTCAGPNRPPSRPSSTATRSWSSTPAGDPPPNPAPRPWSPDPATSPCATPSPSPWHPTASC